MLGELSSSSSLSEGAAELEFPEGCEPRAVDGEPAAEQRKSLGAQRSLTLC